MQDFTALFDQWALHYDETVYDSENEYREVFHKYDEILSTICREVLEKKSGRILEIGVGTGNLTSMLYKNGFDVIGIEPSQQMRKKASKKLPNTQMLEGHFLQIPIQVKFDAIVTSYAFHHLTLEEKKIALKYLDSFLNDNGKIVIADTMFQSENYKKDLYKEVASLQHFNLLNDLNNEYYEYIEDICNIFEELQYHYDIKQMNKYVWIVSANKGGSMK